MKTSNFVAELISAGCYIHRHGKSHDMWVSPITGNKTLVPRHGSKELAKGTELNIRRLLGVPKKKS